MAIDGQAYVPTLAVRASEMNGLEFLPGATKDKIAPCFLLAPWANAASLDKTISRIEKAFPERHYFLDIDRDYEFTNLESDPQQELAQLLDPKNSYQNWIEFVAGHEWIWPCIQTRGQTEVQIRNQIQAFQSIGRTYCMRIARDHYPDNLNEITAAFSASGTSDFVVILDGGWTNDPLSLAMWFSGLLAGGLQIIDASVPTVLSCTSMPKMFTDFSQSTPSIVPFTNRLLIDQVAKGSNRNRIIYGDWGSTRPRDKRGIAARPLDRVDYPTDQSWLIARNKEDGWTFREAAMSIVNSPSWSGNLGIWGEEMISMTTISPELGINTPQKNVASRVNIHIHRQAFYGSAPLDPSAFDEEWKD